MEKRERATTQSGNTEEIEICEICVENPASIGIPQMDGSMLYLCDACYAERGIEGEEIENIGEDSGMFYDPPDFMSGGILEW